MMSFCPTDSFSCLSARFSARGLLCWLSARGLVKLIVFITIFCLSSLLRRAWCQSLNRWASLFWWLCLRWSFGYSYVKMNAQRFHPGQGRLWCRFPTILSANYRSMTDWCFLWEDCSQRWWLLEFGTSERSLTDPELLKFLSSPRCSWCSDRGRSPSTRKVLCGVRVRLWIHLLSAPRRS